MWFDPDYYRDKDCADGVCDCCPSLEEQLRAERADWQRRERERLARNEARDRAQAKWPPLAKNRWTRLADRLAAHLKLTEQNRTKS